MITNRYYYLDGYKSHTYKYVIKENRKGMRKSKGKGRQVKVGWLA